MVGFLLYSRNQKIGPGCDIVLWYHKIIKPLILATNCSYQNSG